jgi:hypothetical protein
VRQPTRAADGIERTGEGDRRPPKKRTRAKPERRKRRPVEADYLAALADAVPPSRWRRIVTAAADLAEKGDAKSREWLARYLMSDKPSSLAALAAEVAAGVPPGDTALLSQLVSRQRHAAHVRQYSAHEHGLAERLIGGLDRTPADEADSVAPGEGKDGPAASSQPS